MMSWFFSIAAAFLVGVASPLALVTRRGAFVGVSLLPTAAFARADFLSGVPTEEQATTVAIADDNDDANGDSLAVARAKERVSSSSRSKDVTERLRFGMRISRSDGTFSARDGDGEALFDDAPAYGDLEIDLFGSLAPASVALFLTFALNDRPRYTLVDERMGDSLALSRIRSLETKQIFGEDVVMYRDTELFSTKKDRAMVAAAYSERSGLSHDAAGLLTRRTRTTGPDVVEFGVTLKPARELDDQWTVFGRVRQDDSHLLSQIASLPTYTGEAKNDSPLAVSVYKAQRDTFRNVAAAIGDTRASSVFQGKILRRVEITQAELLGPS